MEEASLQCGTGQGGSRPWPLENDGDDGEGQEDHSGCASDHEAQGAAVHLHGLAALTRVEEGMSRDAPGKRTQGVQHYLASGSAYQQAPCHMNGREQAPSILGPGSFQAVARPN